MNHESPFIKNPSKTELKRILNMMINSLGFKKLTTNLIFPLSSLKFSNIELEFHIMKEYLKNYYKSEVYIQKTYNQDLKSILNVFNDFFKLNNMIISEYDANKDEIIYNFHIKKEVDKKVLKKNNNLIINDQETYYKIYNLVDYENYLKDVNKNQDNFYKLDF